jgi:hypothetical protein
MDNACNAPYSYCDNDENREHPKCIEFWNEDPEHFACKAD